MTIRLLADENFHAAVVEAVLRARPDLDLITVPQAGLKGKEDPDLLEWATRENRAILTHDVNTMPDFAYRRVGAGLRMPGVFVVAQTVPIGVAISEILAIVDLSFFGEWEGQVVFLPL